MLRINRLAYQLKPYRHLLNCPLRGYGVTTDLLSFEWQRLHGLPFTHKQLVAALDYGILKSYTFGDGTKTSCNYSIAAKHDSPLKKRQEYLAKKHA